MKIERVEIVVVSLPQRRRHLSAIRAERLGLYVITKIHAGGLTGLGEATVLKEWGGDHGRYFGEAPSTTARLLEEFLAPAIIGHDPMAIEQVMTRLDGVVRGYPYAKASIDIALHDLVGKALGVPVAQLLGGVYRDRIPVAHSLGVMDTAALVTEAEQAVAEGVRTLKVKAGFDPRRDVAAVEAVRGAVGDDIALTVDANSGWREAKTAIRIIRDLEAYDVLFIEQPVEGLDAMAQVTQGVDTPIMADESAWTAVDVLEIWRAHAADLVSIYTTKPGGLLRAREAAAVAKAAGIACNVNGSAETGVGNAANVQLAAACSAVTHACVIPVSSPAEGAPTAIVGRSYLDDIIKEPFEYQDGSVCVSRRPGLGVELDDHKMAKYTQTSVVVQ